MVVEQSIRSTHHGFPVALGVPGNSNARLHVIRIRLNAFLDAQEVISRKRQSIWRRKLRRELDVITYAVVQRQIPADPPGILPERSQRFILKRVAGAPNTLDEVCWKSSPVRLHRRQRRKTGRKAEVPRAERAEVIAAAIVHRKRRRSGKVVKVPSKLGGVRANRPRKIVREL